MKLGLVTYQIAKDWDLETIIKNCEETGFQGVELRTGHAHKVEADLAPEERAQVRQRFENSKVKLVGLGTAFEFHSPDPEELRRNIEGAKEYIDLAADLKCPGVKVRPNAFPDGVPQEETLRQIGQALRNVGEHGQHKNVEVRLEVHGRGTADVMQIRTMLDIANHPNVVACWNSNQAEVENGSISTSFRALEGQIGTVHVRDLCLRDYPWRSLFNRLYESGYRGYVLLEAPATPDPIRVMHYARALFECYMAGRQ